LNNHCRLNLAQQRFRASAASWKVENRKRTDKGRIRYAGKRALDNLDESGQEKIGLSWVLEI
jgi:hypothetical protein